MKKSNVLKRIVTFSLPAVILLGVYLIYSGTGIFQNRFCTALKCINAEKYDESVRLLDRIIHTDRENPNAYRKLAEVYYLKNDFQSGWKLIKRLQAIDPENQLLTHAMGYLYKWFGKYDSAGMEYRKVLATVPEYPSIYRDFVDICRKQNKTGLADSLFHKMAVENSGNGYIFYGLGYYNIIQYEWEKADSLLNIALSKRDNILDAYYLKGAIYYNTNRSREFLEISKTGLEKAKKYNDLPYLCEFFGNTGLAYHALEDYKNAIHYISKAIRFSRKTGKKREEIRNIGNLALTFRDLHDFEKALRYYEKALAGSQQLNDRNSEGLWYRNIGSVYQMMGEFTLAFNYYDRALTIAEELGDNYTKWLALFGISTAKYNLGDYTGALDYYEKTLELAETTGNKWAECRCLGGLSMVYKSKGDQLKAIDFSEKALSIARNTDDKECESNALGNIAIIYDYLEDDEKTFEYYKKALEVSRQIGNKDEIARHLGNIGCAYQEEGEYKTALKYYSESIRELKQINDKVELANAYNNMTDLMIAMAEYKKAGEYLKLSSELGKEIGSEHIKIQYLLNSGYLEFRLDHYKNAYKYFGEALKYKETNGIPDLFCEAESGLGLVLEQQNKPEQALVHFNSAIKRLEEMQRMLPVEDFKSGFFKGHMNVYEETLFVLSQLHKKNPQRGYDRQAFRIAEQAKARAFLENLIESRTDVSGGIDVGLKKQEKEILETIAEKQKQLYNSELTHKQRKNIVAELKNSEEVLETVTRKIKIGDSKYKNLFYPDTYSADKVQDEILADHEYILEFSMGDKQSYLWVVSDKKFRFYDLSGKQVIDEAFKEYMHTIEQPVGLTNSFTNHILKSRKLFELLLGQAYQEIEAGSHLIIVPDGVLNYLPFESLITADLSADGSPNYLIQDFTVSYCPSSTSLAIINRERKSQVPGGKYLLAFGNPDFKNSGTGDINASRGLFIKSNDGLDVDEKTPESFYERNGFSFSALPFSGDEVTAIAGLFPDSECVVHLKSDASEVTLKKEKLDKYRYIHFATHGFIEEALPVRSGIVLSMNENSNEDGILQLNEILNLKLNADLVVLSACQTAKGKLFSGEGIVGISRAFFYAGASSVVVCLWNINDRSSALLMKDFYSGLVNGKDKKEALQHAKFNMIHSEYKVYRHPYYWAPYVIIGNFH